MTDEQTFTPPPSDPDQLEAELISLISRAWRRGWMPGDLLAVVDHDLQRRVVKLCAALVLIEHEASGYGDRLTPAWQRQLRLLRDLVPHPAPVMAGRHREWEHDRLMLWFRLRSLPTLQMLGALPGEADPAASRPAAPSGSAPGEVDENVLARVRAMLAKAESTNFEAEAEAFTAKAQALIATYSLADALAADQGETASDPLMSSRLAIERPYPTEKFGLLAEIGEANRCRVILHQHLGLATVVGFPVDREATELLFTSLLLQATRAMQRHGSQVDRTGASTTASFRRSFLEGFAVRISDRLRTETARAAEEAAATSGDLLPALASRQDRVDRAVQEAFPSVRPMRESRARVNDHGYFAGVDAADRARLDANRPLAS